MNLNRLIEPLRLMIVDDQLRTNKLDQELREAAARVAPRSEVIAFSKATRAREKLKELREHGKNVHAIVMDYKLNADDITAIDFIEEYITQHPGGYWFWSSAYPAEAYNDLLASPRKGVLHRRMLTGYNKSDGGFRESLKHLIKCLNDDLRGHGESETKALILTDRDTLNVLDDSLVRNENAPKLSGKNSEFSVFDELVPGCRLFDSAVVIHVPSLPADATRFTDAIISRKGDGRVKTSEQRRLRGAWVARKYFKPVHIATASNVSKDFDSSNWSKYATQFNLNLTWLDAASESGWGGSLLATRDGGTGLSEDLEAVARATEKGAVWSNIGPRNFNSQFRPWAAVYRSLRAPAFFEGVDVAGKVRACDENLPHEALSLSIRMRVSPDAELYIDRRHHLYDVRRGVEVPLHTSAGPQTAKGVPTSTAQSKPDTAAGDQMRRGPKTGTRPGLSKKSSAKGKNHRRGGK